MANMVDVKKFFEEGPNGKKVRMERRLRLQK